jgi:hypothetical protein
MNWNTILLAIIALMNTAIVVLGPVAIVSFIRSRQEAKQARDEVARKLEMNGNEVKDEVGKVVRRLDGQKSVFLRTIAAAMRGLANAHPDDLAAAAVAEQAEKDLREHEAELAKADAAIANKLK